MIKLEIKKGDCELSTEGFRSDLATECVVATCALAKKFASILGVPDELGLMIMAKEATDTIKVMEEGNGDQ
jgi:hypothetical protein